MKVLAYHCALCNKPGSPSRHIGSPLATNTSGSDNLAAVQNMLESRDILFGYLGSCLPNVGSALDL